jgi:hypothetical protein
VFLLAIDKVERVYFEFCPTETRGWEINALKLFVNLVSDCALSMSVLKLTQEVWINEVWGPNPTSKRSWSR